MLQKCFSQLISRRLLEKTALRQTDDGFVTAVCSLSDILSRADIHTLYNAQGEARRCDRYFDDWYLYTVTLQGDTVVSLLKMREQEADAHLPADADTPGVTICFIAFDFSALLRCLDHPSRENLQALNQEINRVVALRGQRHHPLLKSYWARTSAQAPYLIAPLYAQHAASFAQNGLLPVPLRYDPKNRRLHDFIERNNQAAGYTVCDHTVIFVGDPQHLTHHEALAILATHTANTSLHSFAAEIQYHARCLHPWLRLRLPGMRKSLYDSAVRADMTIDSSAWHNLLPFYRAGSKCLKAQQDVHPNA